MKRPTWATVVGVLGIIIGIGGLLFSAQTAVTPKMMQFQKEMMVNMEKTVSLNPQDVARLEPFRHMMDTIMRDIPAWFNPACLAAGIVGLLIYAFYIYAAISVLQVKANSISLFYKAIGLSIVLSVLKAIMNVSAFPIMGFATVIWGIIGVALNLVLLAVVAVGNKAELSSAFESSSSQ